MEMRVLYKTSNKNKHQSSNDTVRVSPVYFLSISIMLYLNIKIGTLSNIYVPKNFTVVPTVLNYICLSNKIC